MPKKTAKKKVLHTPKPEETWGILELMGHVRLAGRVSEEERFGSKLGRIDIPKTEGKFVTQYFGGCAVYRFTVTSEDVARAAAGATEPNPPHKLELLGRPAEKSVDWDKEDNCDFDEAPF